MRVQRISAMVLIMAGALAAGYGGLSYAAQVDNANPGSIGVSFGVLERFDLVMWAGVCAIVVGTLLQVAGSRLLAKPM